MATETRARSPKVPEIRKGDTVVVLSGKDAGKRGTVERVIRRAPSPRGTRSVFRRGSAAGGVSVVIEGINIAKRHTKPRQTASSTDRMPKIQQGGILEIAQPVPVGKVMLVCGRLRQADAHRPSDPRQRTPRPRLQELWRAAGGEVVTSRLHERYAAEVVPALQKQFDYGNPNQVPKVSKIVVNIGLGEALSNAKALDAALGDLATITGQRPIVTKAKRSIAQFRLRTGNSIGAKVTLRGERMWDFLDRLTTLALPRIRDFRGVPGKSFDGRGNYSLGMREQLAFPEIDYDKVDRLRGLEISIVTTAKSDEESKKLLELLGMPFAS